MSSLVISYGNYNTIHIIY